MGDFLESIIPEKSYLNNVLDKLVSIIGSEEFNEFITASGLVALDFVKKGYPNLDSQSIKTYEGYVNTSSAQNCLVWDVESGVDVLAIVDIYLPDKALKHIWKYADATLQWLWQFNASSLAILDMTTRIYAKACGDSANHFTLSIHLLPDKFVDSDLPTLVDES